MNPAIYHRPILPLLAAMIFGIAAGDQAEGFLPWAMVAACLGCLFMLRAAVEKKDLVFSPFVLFFCLGYLSIQPWTAPNVDESHASRFDKPWKWEITGVVEKDPVSVLRDRAIFVLRVESLGKDGEKIPSCGRLRVTCRGEPLPEIRPGDRLRFPGKIRRIRNFHNPGGFDYERYMAFRSIRASSYTSSKNLEFLRKDTAGGFARWMHGFRKRISSRIEAASIANPSKSVLKALVIGDRDAIDKPLREAFNRAGMGHLLAISGLHVGIVASFFFLVFSRLLSQFRFVTDHAWVRKAAALLCLPPVVLYGFLAGMSPSTQRAVVMVAVFLLAFPIEREHDPANTLGIAAMAILIIDPPALFSISFQLSFSAVTAIFLGFSALDKLRSEEERTGSITLTTKLAGFFFASLFAIMGTMPLAMRYFNQVSLAGIAANFVLVPLVGFGAVPLGLLAAFVLPVSETVSALGFECAGFVLSVAIGILHFFADLTFAAVKTFTPTFFEVFMYYAFLGLLYVVANQQKQTGAVVQADPARQEKGVFPPSRKRVGKSLAMAAFLTLSVLALADILYWTVERFFDDKLAITVVDVGQGNAAVVEFPKGETVLIDGGGFYDNSIFDVGERIVAPLLWRNKIMSVDALYLTHPNSDHLNGLLYIARHFDVETFGSNNEPAETRGYRELMEIVRKERIESPPFFTILGRRNVDGFELEVLYPPADFLQMAKTESWRDENSNSLVIRISKGRFSCLFTGDITSDSEKELVEMHGDRLKSLVMVAPHHGSDTSSSEIFLDAVDPKVAIVCAGWRNRFGLPSPEVIQRYEKRGVWIYRTDLDGAVAIRTDGDSTEIEPFVKERFRMPDGQPPGSSGMQAAVCR